MKKIVKENIKVLFGIMIGLSLGSIGVFASSLIASKDVSYENTLSSVNNVQKAIEELYDSSKNYIKLSIKDTLLSEHGLRYTGIHPNNYVTFNNEIWRILGVIDGKIKIVRGEIIGNMPFNLERANDWKSSSLYNYLNTTYYNSLDTTSKNMIENATWKTGGGGWTKISTAEMYGYEGTVQSIGSSSLNVTSFIGLMSASDYGYASSRCYAGSKSLMEYNDVTCTSSNWLSSLINAAEWTISSPSQDSTAMFLVYPSGAMDGFFVDNDSVVVRPAVYLKENVFIKSGTGTSSDPYVLEMN